MENLGCMSHTALHVAVFFGLEEIAKLLLEESAVPDSKDKDSQMPHSWATEHGHCDVAKLC
jgi:ankyrin repeat protein